MSNGIEPCIICGGEASCIAMLPDKYDYRCDNCGMYIFLNGLNEGGYKDLNEEEREKISKYVREYNETTGDLAELGDIVILWRQIEDFNRNKKNE